MAPATRNWIWKLGELMQDRSEPPEAIVGDGILLRNTLLLIHGSPKAGKSMFAMNMAMGIAGGRSFAGFRIPRPRKVMLLSAEGGHRPNRDRVERMMSVFDDSNPVKENLYGCFDWRELLDSTEGFQLLEKKIVELKPDVLGIDPLVRFHQGEENSATDMTKVFRKIRSLIEDYNLSVILVHHDGKDGERGARGSSVIQGEYDSSIGIQKTKDGVVLRFDMRHVETPPDKVLGFNPDTFWFEQHTDSPIVRILIEAGHPLSKKELADALVRAGLYGKPSNAYKPIYRAVDRGLIELNDDEQYVVM